jgi:EmrB/QacA subfamily drug resistance transporter
MTEATALRDEVRPKPAPRELRIVFAALMLAMVMASLDQNIVNTALPRMASDLGGLAHISWVVTAFMLTSTITTPFYGKLSDMYGRRRMMIISISVFLAASVLCGTAQTMTQLILFRALQGLGAGGLITLAQTIVGDMVGPRERGRYQGLFTGAFAISSVAGPLLGGILTSALSWRWVFYVNIPVGTVALTLILIGLKPAPPSGRHKIDYAGGGLLAIGTAATLVLLSSAGTMTPWGSPLMIGIVGAAAMALILFIRQERHAPEPVIDLKLFHIRAFAVGVASSGMMSFAMMGSLVFLPLFFQLVEGLSPIRAGFMMLPQIGGMVVSSVIIGRISSRMGVFKPFLLGGVGLEFLALAALALLALNGSSLYSFLFALGALGLGMGSGMPMATVIVQNGIDRKVLGAATGAMSFIRTLGGALGIALSGGVMAMRLAQGLKSLPGIDIDALMSGGMNHIAQLPPDQRLAVTDAYRLAIGTSFAMSGVVMLGALMLITTLPRVRRTPSDNVVTIVPPGQREIAG